MAGEYDAVGLRLRRRAGKRDAPAPPSRSVPPSLGKRHANGAGRPSASSSTDSTDSMEAVRTDPDEGDGSSGDESDSDAGASRRRRRSGFILRDDGAAQCTEPSAEAIFASAVGAAEAAGGKRLARSEPWRALVAVLAPLAEAQRLLLEGEARRCRHLRRRRGRDVQVAAHPHARAMLGRK